MTTETGRDSTRAAFGESDGASRWALLTNHGAALLYVAEHPNATVRQVGDGVGITERAAARILRDLRVAGYLETTRIGRRNSYEINPTKPMRHSATRNRKVAHLLVGLLDDGDRLQARAAEVSRS